MKRSTLLVIVLSLFSVPALAQNESGELAKELQNPLAHLISVPMQLNYDKDIGPNEDGALWQLNIQPVYPFTLNEDWHLILSFTDLHGLKG